MKQPNTTWHYTLSCCTFFFLHREKKTHYTTTTDIFYKVVERMRKRIWFGCQNIIIIIITITMLFKRVWVGYKNLKNQIFNAARERESERLTWSDYTNHPFNPFPVYTLYYGVVWYGMCESRNSIFSLIAIPTLLSVFVYDCI